jgi:hypothetical protein
MNHPSSADFFEFVDQRLSEKRAGEIAAHIAECGQCRKRLTLERSTRSIVRSEFLVKAPASMSSSVMVNLGSPRRDSIVLRLLGKFGAVVAMLIVLSVIGFVIAQVSNVADSPEARSSPVTKIISPISDIFTSGTQSLVDRSSAISEAIESKTAPEFWKTLCLVILTIGVLAGADRVFGKRFIKLKS